MSNPNEEVEEVKNLCKHQLASIVWPPRLPKDEAAFLVEFLIHIRNKFNETSPAKYTKELNELEKMRNIAISTLGEGALRDNNSLTALKLYYCQIAAMLGRFKDSGAVFSWKDSYSRDSAEGNLEFELNNIMYNIAAIHNELGAKIARRSETATLEACVHFKNALWWVTELRDNRSGLKPKELGHDSLTFYHHVLRAQAQECALAQSILMGMKPETVARIAAQIANDYEVSSKLCQSPLYTDPLYLIMHSAPKFQNWKATVEFKYNFYSAVTQMFMGLASSMDSAKEIGFRIARLKIASQSLSACKKLVPDTLDNQTTKIVYEQLESLINKKIDKAIRYNDNVYHSTIPTREILPQPEARLLIAPEPFVRPRDFKDLFSSLVTIEAVQDSSIYSQKKDELRMKIDEEVERKDDELARMLSTLNLDQRSLRLPSLEAPDELIDLCAELSMNPNVVDDVLTKLEELDDKSAEIQEMLDKIQGMLKRNPERNFEIELSRLRATHEEALRTTQTLHKQLTPELQRTIQLMATTSNPLELLPKVTRTSAEDEIVIRKLEKYLGKVDEMKHQRAKQFRELKDKLNQDDVLNHVVAASSKQDIEKIFDKEIQKHKRDLDSLTSNLEAQQELLDEIEQAYAQYGQIKLNHRAQRATYLEKVDSLKKMYSSFQATSAGIEEGLKYQSQMSKVVEKLLKSVQDAFGKVQAQNEINDLLN